jgi:hypothetical protein
VFSSTKPKIETVENADGEENRPRQQESPHEVGKTVEDVCEPCTDAGYKDKV